jgi:transposase InsO family protein
MIQGHRERIESGSQVTIVDAGKGTIIVLNAATKTYTQSVMKPVAHSSTAHHASAPRFQPTGAQRTIAGYKCQVFRASSTTSRGDQTVTGCFSSAVPGWKEYRELNALLALRTGGEAASVELPPGLPLSVVTSLKVRYQLSPKIAPAQRAEMERILANKPPLVGEELVTSIKKVTLSPSLFAVPSGYTKLLIAGPVED